MSSTGRIQMVCGHFTGNVDFRYDRVNYQDWLDLDARCSKIFEDIEKPSEHQAHVYHMLGRFHLYRTFRKEAAYEYLTQASKMYEELRGAESWEVGEVLLDLTEVKEAIEGADNELTLNFKAIEILDFFQN